MTEALQIRVHGPAELPALIYLPGLHGDWTLIGGLRASLVGRVRFVEFTYPRTVAWSLDDYAAAIEGGCWSRASRTDGCWASRSARKSFGHSCEGRGVREEVRTGETARPSPLSLRTSMPTE